MLFFFKIIAIAYFTLGVVHALDSQKCSKMLNNGMWKTYRYGGVGEAYHNAVTQGTKKDGLFKTSSQSSTTEPTTASTDTKYTSNISTSQTQSTSSWGDCSLFALQIQLREERMIYIAQNLDELKIEMTRGEGEHLKVLTFYSACEKDAYPSIASYIKQDYEKFAGMTTRDDIIFFASHLDHFIKNSHPLKSKCYVL
ncbi:MAG: hypothetical protein A2X86_09730 [Bdellovibrionales bacterium GWA2_49_15]|nr:MAG: hypothetical protein A2X86_09730 [Bdellovibrionales bacterium GWA2_49_15]HAZ13061.1 hypothetical protein [Bdellovibrionales bacterium]